EGFGGFTERRLRLRSKELGGWNACLDNSANRSELVLATFDGFVSRQERSRADLVAACRYDECLGIRLRVHGVDPLALDDAVQRVHVFWIVGAWQQVPGVHVGEFEVVTARIASDHEKW